MCVRNGHLSRVGAIIIARPYSQRPERVHVGQRGLYGDQVGQDTKTLNERLFDMSLGDNRSDIAWFGDPRLTAVWGGIVLRSGDGTILGAPGESGRSPEQDEEIGHVGARIFAAL
jgi:hypothetical protein